MKGLSDWWCLFKCSSHGVHGLLLTVIKHKNTNIAVCTLFNPLLVAKKGLINSSVFADILLSHSDSHTQINTCIKYSQKLFILAARQPGKHFTHTYIGTHTHTHIPRQQLVGPHKSSLPPLTELEVQIKFVFLRCHWSLVIHEHVRVAQKQRRTLLGTIHIPNTPTVSFSCDFSISLVVLIALMKRIQTCLNNLYKSPEVCIL